MDGRTDDGDPTTCDCFVRSDGIRDNAASYNNATRNSLFEIAPHFSDTSIKRKKKKRTLFYPLRVFGWRKSWGEKRRRAPRSRTCYDQKGGKRGRKRQWSIRNLENDPVDRHLRDSFDRFRLHYKISIVFARSGDPYSRDTRTILCSIYIVFYKIHWRRSFVIFN